MTKLIVCIIAIFIIFRLLFTAKDKKRLQDFFNSKPDEGEIIEGEIVDDDNDSNKGDKT